ncbi:GlsB/YeaQ/YmgE family stress response membrane protein [Vulcaniibacterium tengchongense]|uniref:Putative membrane protein YeaQ/YmgE (Transglycosylase-associated protein family) n=1 Tax=Vulcaniibacterium tengchongense TaxID=1273429 RepID=A0A3N4V2R1_9GAMM|nr:GlsB/YeaQ/YmgE family stress response membrane protein [Vulcaniibacterium tengchongense]RPE77262.1 putative membrane protein YeaQ/YmgE (transglycosylase-associated protein family) [Vulcaniibacterium tengchongense]
MGSIVYTIIIGAVIGVLARFFKPGADPMGWILTILLGIAGAWLGSLVYAGGGFIGFVISILCAIALLFVYELIRKKTAKPAV